MLGNVGRRVHRATDLQHGIDALQRDDRGDHVDQQAQPAQLRCLVTLLHRQIGANLAGDHLFVTVAWSALIGQSSSSRQDAAETVGPLKLTLGEPTDTHSVQCIEPLRTASHHLTDRLRRSTLDQLAYHRRRSWEEPIRMRVVSGP